MHEPMSRADNIGTNDTEEVKPVGNTKKSLRARFWCFTWNNYDSDWKAQLTRNFADCASLICQPEVGESGTKHLQGYVEYRNPKRFDTIRKLLPKAHWETSRSKAAIAYCQKTETRDGDTFTLGIQKPKSIRLDFYTWQLALNEMIESSPDPRKITWIVDAQGGKGKTTYCKYLCMTRTDTIYCCGKAADIRYGITDWINEQKKPLKVVLMDFTRSLENYVSYEGIESIKNGIFYNTKYKSGQVVFDTPHVICFSNFDPDEERLSADRWDIRRI